MDKWINLTTNQGEGIQNPSNNDLKEALKALFQQKDDEHPDAWLELGSDDGPLYNLSVFSSGYAIFIKYSDADMSEELEQKTIQNVTEELAFRLWKSLIDEDFEKI